MAITASAVAGTKAGSPRATRPAFSGVAPSTSLAGSIRLEHGRRVEMRGQRLGDDDAGDARGRGSDAPMRAVRSESWTPSGGTTSTGSMPTLRAARAEARRVDRRRPALVEAHDRQARRDCLLASSAATRCDRSRHRRDATARPSRIRALTKASSSRHHRQCGALAVSRCRSRRADLARAPCPAAARRRAGRAG